VSIVFGFGVGVLVVTGLVMYTTGVGVMVETMGVMVETVGVLVIYMIGVGVLVETGGVLVIYMIGVGVFFEPDGVLVETGSVFCIFAGGVVNILDIFICICFSYIVNKYNFDKVYSGTNAKIPTKKIAAQILATM